MANQQEYLIKMQMIQQEAGQLEEKTGVIDQQISEMQAIKTSLEDLDKKKEDDEMMSNLGKGIFLKTAIKEKELLINVGKDIMIKKSVKETIAVLDDQMSKLVVGKEEAMARMQDLQGEMMAMIKEAEIHQKQEAGDAEDKKKTSSKKK